MHRALLGVFCVLASGCGTAPTVGPSGPTPGGRATVTPPDAAELRRIRAEVAASEHAAALAQRQKLRLGAFLQGVFHPDETIDPLYNVTSFMVGLQLGVRYGLGGPFDFQARTGLSGPLAGGGASMDVPDREARESAACQAAGGLTPRSGAVGDEDLSAGGFLWTLDATLRLRYAGSLVPAFIGLGPWLVVAHASGSGSYQVFCAVDDDWSHDVPTTYHPERSATTLLAGGLFELGTLVGSHEQFELGFRANAAASLTGVESSALLTLELYFGVMFL